MPTTTLTADAAPFDAYKALPTEARRGGLVICTNLWGVTPSIRALADTFAAEGYEVLIPDILDPAGTAFPERDSDPELFDSQRAKVEALGWGVGCLPRIQASIDALAGPVFLMGFSAGWLAACRCEGITAASCIYGGHHAFYLDETPRCPTILHIVQPQAQLQPNAIEAIRERHPDMAVHEYTDGQALMNLDGARDDGDLALLRTRALFHRTAGKGEHGA